MAEKLIGVFLFVFSAFFLALRITRYRIWGDELLDESTMVNWFINLRYFAFGVAVAISSVALYIFDIAEFGLTKVFITAASMLIGVVNLGFSKLKSKLNPLVNLRVQMFTDLVLVTLLIYLSGGVESPFSALYVIHTFIAAIIFKGRASYFVSVLSLALFLFVAILEFFGILPHHTLLISKYHGKLIYQPFYVASIFASLGVLLFVSGYFASKLADGLRKKLENERKIFADMAHTARLVELGEFAGIISHEVGNFLGAIIMKVKNILEHYDKQVPEKFIKDVRIIEERSMKISEVLRGILNFLRPVEYKSRFKVEESVGNILMILQLRIKKLKISVSTNFLRTKYIEANKAQIEQVIFNLLNNSIDAIERKKDLQNEKMIRIATYEEGEFLVLEISDSGEGIPDNLKDKIFEPFFSTKPNGAGLGLYIAKKIVESHGGKIEFDSKENRGTTFRVILPYPD